MDTVDRSLSSTSLIGAIVRQAIVDAHSKKTRQRSAEKIDAKEFISTNRLDDFFMFWGYPKGTARYTRSIIKKTMRCKHKTLTMKRDVV